jgi:gas vesicle protein
MERDDEDRSDRSVLLSVLAGIGIGAIVGAVAGLLFAPKAGEETRERIGQTLSNLGNRITDLSDQVSTRVRSAVEAGRHAMERDNEEPGGRA